LNCGSRDPATRNEPKQDPFTIIRRLAIRLEAVVTEA